MYCSPQLHPPATALPTGLRDWLGARLSGPARGPRHEHRQLCVFALGWVGDFVLALPGIRLVLGKHAPAGCTLVIAPAVAALAQTEFPGVECLLLPVECSSLARDILPLWWRERARLSSVRHDRLVCFSHQRPLHYELALSWIDAGQDFRLLPASYPTMTAGELCTELRAHRELAEQVLGRPVSREEILPRFTGLAPGDDGRLVVYPFSRDVARNLAPAHVIRVLRLWREGSRAPIVLGGSPAEAPQLRHCAELARSAGLEISGIETPHGIDRLLQHVAQAGAVLSADSAAGHIATALDKPCVVITTPGFFGYCQPWTRSGRQQVFLADAPAGAVAAALPAL
ncbi:MAG: glycosyltransferase family 9 protein [Lacunisphaera sp.]|nr:glycosyltransferase family 9 protein [Lacunisphaera sp.]